MLNGQALMPLEPRPGLEGSIPSEGKIIYQYGVASLCTFPWSYVNVANVWPRP